MLLCLTAVRAAAAQEVTVERDLPYVAEPHPEQTLDLHWPEARPVATVLFVHGGGLSESGERRTSPPYADVCDSFVEHAIACANTDYRLAPSFRWPAMPLDVAAAVVEVRRRVQERGGDPGRLVLFGHSSGCHIVAALGTNPAYLESMDLEPGDLAGVVAMGCILDNRDAALRGLTADDIRPRFESETSRYESPEAWIGGTPSYHVGPHAPPFLVVVAREERFFPSILEQGARFVRRLLEADVPADLVIVRGRHMSSIERFGESGDPTFPLVRAFVENPSGVGSG